MTALQALARILAEDLQATPDGRVLVTRHLGDLVGAWIAGSGTREGRRLVAWRASLGGEALADDVALACALARLSEIDNIHLESSTTPGGIVVPAALAIGARIGAGGDALAAAVLAGVEAMVRLGAAIGGPTVLYRGIWPTYITAPFGVAAAAARLYDLDARYTAEALALALTLAAAGVGHHNASTTSRWFAVAQMSRQGVVAADGARAGFTSDLNLLDGPFLPAVYGITPDLAVLTAPLTEPALARCSFKPWCAARQTMAATQALKEILAGGVAADEITAVEARVPPPYHKMVDHGVARGDRASFLTSLPYHLAVAALDPDAPFDIGSSPPELAKSVQTFMAKVTVVADESLLAHYPRAWPAELTVRIGAGAARVKRVLHVPGDPERPLLDGQLEAKFRRVVRPLAGMATDAIWKACRSAAAGGVTAAGLYGDIRRTIEQGGRV